MGQTFNAMGWEDREVKVKRDELLAVLKKNRESHIAAYEEACKGYRAKGYRAAALKRIDEICDGLKAKIHGLKDGQTIAITGLQFGLDVPVSHAKAYDQIIRMMEMSVDQEITLTCSQFGCFVMDDWDWKEQWEHSNKRYR